MGKDKAKIIDIIRKCLAKGDKTRNDSLAEVETALAMAQKLMTAHNISMTEVQYDAEHNSLKEGITENDSHRFNGARWRTVVFFVVDILCNTQHYLSWRNGEKVIVFVGIKDDVDMALMLTEELIKAIKRLRRGSESVNAFSYGCARRLYERAQEMKKAEEVPTNTQALMVVKSREIDRFLATKGLKSGRARSQRYDSADYSRGYAAGDSINLGRPRKQLTY